MSDLSIAEYQHLASRTINHDLDERQLQLHALHGLAAEVGVIHGIFQKVYQGHKLDLAHLREEIGDCAWFLVELCTAFEFDAEEVLRENIEKLEKRYPGAGFDPERSLHREEA